MISISKAEHLSRPGGNSEMAYLELFNTLDDMVQECTRARREVVMVGDFNCDVLILARFTRQVWPY